MSTVQELEPNNIVVEKYELALKPIRTSSLTDRLVIDMT